MLVNDRPLGLGSRLGGAEIGEAFGSVRAVPCQQTPILWATGCVSGSAMHAMLQGVDLCVDIHNDV